MDNVFTVRGTHLSRLGNREAVELFHDLLLAEAYRIGIPANKVHVSLNITIGDGGIDASVDSDSITANDGLLKPGRTCYQIKTGTNFAPWQESDIKKELRDGSKQADQS